MIWLSASLMQHRDNALAMCSKQRREAYEKTAQSIGTAIRVNMKFVRSPLQLWARRKELEAPQQRLNTLEIRLGTVDCERGPNPSSNIGLKTRLVTQSDLHAEVGRVKCRCGEDEAFELGSHSVAPLVQEERPVARPKSPESPSRGAYDGPAELGDGRRSRPTSSALLHAHANSNASQDQSVSLRSDGGNGEVERLPKPQGNSGLGDSTPGTLHFMPRRYSI